jgi:hypothetical protein
MKKVFILFLLASAAGVLHADDTTGSSSQSQGTKGNGSSYSGALQQYGNQGQTSSDQTQGTATDTQLSSKIQSALGIIQGKYDNVTVTISGGNVTLQGTVNAQADKDSLGSLVGGISGVRSVNNLVTVQSSSSGANSSGYSTGYQNTETTTSKYSSGSQGSNTPSSTSGSGSQSNTPSSTYGSGSQSSTPSSTYGSGSQSSTPSSTYGSDSQKSTNGGTTNPDNSSGETPSNVRY